MSSILTLQALLIDEIKDLYNAEKQLLKALPKMAKAASNLKLKAEFTTHLVETKTHVERLVKAMQILNIPVKGKTCHAMSGLVEEGAEAIELKGPDAVRDAALIGSAQRVEHYEMAGYGTARAFAEALGLNDVAKLLTATLNEEGETNQKLTEISTQVNSDALGEEKDKIHTPTRKTIF